MNDQPSAEALKIAHQIMLDARAEWSGPASLTSEHSIIERHYAVALTEARQAGESAGWDAAVQELRNVGGSWSCDSSQIADYLADTKPRALTPSPEGRSS